MKRALFVIVETMSVLLCGCALKFKDASNEPEYSPLLNTRYSLKTNMFIYGVNLPPGYGSDIDIYKMSPISSKIRGREIVTEGFLTSGTVVEVQSIRKSTNHLPGWPSVDAVVTVNPYKKMAKVPIAIDLRHLQSTNYMNKMEKIDSLLTIDPKR